MRFMVATWRLGEVLMAYVHITYIFIYANVCICIRICIYRTYIYIMIMHVEFHIMIHMCDGPSCTI